MNRKIDDLGRIVIPKEMRNKLNIKEGDEVNIRCNGNEIIISKENKPIRYFISFSMMKNDKIHYGRCAITTEHRLTISDIDTIEKQLSHEYHGTNTVILNFIEVNND